MQHTTSQDKSTDRLAPNGSDGLRKAAVLISALEPHQADKLLDQLPDTVARHIREIVCELLDVDESEERRTILEFLGGATPQISRPSAADAPDTHDFIDSTVPNGPLGNDTQPKKTVVAEQSTSRSPAAHESLPVSDKPFDFLCDVDMRRLVEVLENERPSIIAIVISHLPHAESLRVLRGLRPLIQSQVVRCMLESTSPDPIVLQDVEQVLRTRLHRDIAIGKSMETTDAESLAEMFRGSEGRRILENLAAYDPALAEQLGRQLVNTPSGRSIDFDDLTKLTADALATVFRTADKEEVVLSLIDAPATLVRRVLRALSPRDARLLERGLNHPGPLRLSDIDQARSRIARLARRMIREGRIDPPKFKTSTLETVFA